MLRESFDSIMDVLLVEAESLRYMITWPAIECETLFNVCCGAAYI
jgi:hypothetical protein